MLICHFLLGKDLVLASYCLLRLLVSCGGENLLVSPTGDIRIAILRTALRDVQLIGENTTAKVEK